MDKHFRNFSVLATYFFCLLIPTHGAFAQSQSSRSGVPGLRVENAYHSTTFWFLRQQNGVFSAQGYYPGSLMNYAPNVRLEVDIESLDEMVLIRQTVLQDDIRPPLALTFNEYVRLLQEQQMKKYWREYAALNATETEQGKRGAGGINFEIPVKIKSKTFQKIFGSGSVGLVVSGNIRIQAGLRREDRSEVRTAITRGASTNFKMQQTQRFSVTGRIGDKVTVNVDQDSERAFEFDNNVKLVYQGYDDEVVRRFEAGNISLSLPGTRYVTFSGKNSGLFGLKSEMVLGSLNLTTIASQEKGQSQRLSLTGGATSGSHRIEDYRFLANQYFFLDDDYRRQYRYFNADGVHALIDSIATPIFSDSIEVYKAAAGYESTFPDRVIQGQATLDGQPVPPDQFIQQAGAAAAGKFIRLERNEYTVQYELGYIRMNTPVTDNEILAVAYKTTNGQVFGDLNFARADTTGAEVINLKLLRDRSPLPTHATYPLAWKHVYSLGSRNISEDGFDIKMFNKPSSGPPQETDNGTFWVEIFALDEKDEVGTIGSPDGKVDLDINILDLARGELHFRDLKPFDPEGYFVLAGGQPTLRNRLNDDLRSPEIYDQTDQTIIRGASKFYLQVATKNRGTEYNLGFNVIEGSEVVTLNGTTLKKGRDYTIDYFSGQLIMLNEQASNPSAQLDIAYERNQLFQLEKKTILGMRAEYNLGKDSFIGGTLLYLSESTLDQKVRVGRGPMQNVVWDLNTRLKFRPNFIGKALDAMPLIRAKGETSLNLEGEIAQVMPNPNTLNSKDTGDNNGVAYIDDFESAKKATNLGVLRRNWSLASAPDDGRHDHSNKLNNFVWYNPVAQVSITQIFPEREVNANTGDTRTHVLRMDLFDPEDPQPDSTRWAGVMRALSPGFFDQSQTKFIEIMVQGERGRLHIDMGSISEDVIANNNLDSEDEIEAGIRNRILDDGEDRGLDNVVRADPPELNYPRTNHVGDTIQQAPYDFWDVNNNGIKDADEPWSYDDWFYDGLSDIYITEGTGSIDGSENSRNDEGGRIPDTEDINANSILDQVNQYFSYSFSLEPDSPDASLIVGGNDDPTIPGGPWKLYRIPFNNEAADTLVGSPSRSLIEYIRIWVDDLEYSLNFSNSTLPAFDRITIAEINLVGSEWKERGIAGDEYGLTDLESSDSIGDRFAITQINTFESPEYAATLNQIGVQGERDKVSLTRAREQSLVLKSSGLVGLEGGKAGIAQKSLFQGENYIRYDRIRMFVYGLDEGMNHFAFMTQSDSTARSKLEYFVRFGSDDNNFYEYRSTIYPEWDDRNHMDLAILDFTSIERDTTAGANGPDVTYDDSLGIWIKRISDEKSIVVKGSPSFTNIRRLTLGIKNKLDNTPFLGEIWFNELRLSDVQKDKGMAMRVRADMRIGSFGTINVEMEKKDDDFHNVATRFGTGNNSLSTSLNANVNIDQILPQSWGIAMPLSLNFRESESDPKYFPGLDREVTQTDLSDSTTLAKIQTKSTQTGFNISFRRQAKSKNFFVKNTLDNMSWSLGRSKNEQHSPTIAESRTTSWNGNFDYRLTFGRNNFFKPLGWLPGLPIIKNAKETKLYFTPQNVSFRVNGARTERFSQNRIQNSDQLAEPNETKNFIFDRSVRASMKIFENLTVDFNRAQKAQMKDKKFNDFLKFDFLDISKTQAFTVRYSPQVFSWLTNNLTYTANYRWANNLQNQSTGRSANNSITRQADFNFRWKQLVQSIFGGGSKQTPRRGRPRGRPGTGGRGTNQEDPGRVDNFSYFQQESPGSSFNPLNLIRDFFSGFKDIQFSYSERNDNRQSGLSDKEPSAKFQFGLDDDTGVGTVTDLSGTFLNRSETKNMSVSSGIALGRAIDIGLRFQQNDQENNSFQTSGSTATGSSSRSFLMQDLDNGGGLPFPEWNVRIAGLNSLPFFSRIFTNVTFSHAFTGQKSESWTGNSGNLTTENFTRNFRPLGKLDLNFKNGFTGSVQLNRSNTLTKTFSNGQPIGASRNTNQDISVTANYSKRSGFRLPFWPFNKAELKNSIDFAFRFTASEVVQENTQNVNADFSEANKTTRWSVSPRLTYSFSTTVRGGAFIEIGKTNSKRVGTTKVQEFGIDVNIAIRGN